MVNNDDWFEYVDNFKKIEDIPSYCIFENRVKDALVTIGIPTYKRSRTIIDAINSSIEQNCSFSYDIIVLDNNPDRNDETEIVMNNYSNAPMVSYYKNIENLGMGGNWNRLFSLASSKWVVLLHDDDMLDPSFLQEMISVANKYEADVVNSAFLLWYEEREIRPVCKREKNSKVILSTLSMNFFGHLSGMPSGILYKRDVYIKEGGVNQDYFPSLDYVFHTKLSMKYRFLIYSKKLTTYRLSLNESNQIETKKKCLLIDYQFRDYIGELLELPKWFVSLYNNLVAGMRIKDIGIDSIYIGTNCIHQNSLFQRVLYSFIYRFFVWYYDKKYCLGDIN